MKITAITLAILISFLAIKPGVEVAYSMVTNVEIHCCEGKCHSLSDKAMTQKQEQEKDCDGENCNPFQVCSLCVLMVKKVIPFDGLLKLTVPSKAGFTYQSSFTSPHISDIWHPPEVV